MLFPIFWRTESLTRILIAVLAVGIHPGVTLAQQTSEVPKKEHASLFKYKTGKKLPELAVTSQDAGPIGVEMFTHADWGLPPDPLPSYPHPYLVVVSRGADAVVIGVAKKGVSALTADEGFIYSDWEFEVEEILKDNASSPLSVFGGITVTRPGGTLTLHGKEIYARETNFLSFVPGARYLLFLKFLPKTNAYEAFGDMSFRLEQRKVHVLSKSDPLSQTGKTGPTEFLAEVRAAISYRK